MKLLFIFFLSNCFLISQCYQLQGNKLLEDDKIITQFEYFLINSSNGFFTGLLQEDWPAVKNCVINETDLVANFKRILDQFIHYSTSNNLIVALIQYIMGFKSTLEEIDTCTKYSEPLYQLIQKFVDFDIDYLVKQIMTHVLVYGIQIIEDLTKFYEAVFEEDYFDVGYFLGNSIRSLLLA